MKTEMGSLTKPCEINAWIFHQVFVWRCLTFHVVLSVRKCDEKLESPA